MAGMQVDKIKVGELDSAGNRVNAVYAKVSGTYAVYCTDAHVMVHFSDDEKLGAEQRLCLVSLQDMRGKIDELSADLLLQNVQKGEEVVTDIRRQMAFALQIALQGQNEIALLRLTRLHDKLVNQKESSARLYYLASAFAILLGVMLLSWFATSSLFVDDPDANRLKTLLWIAFSVGGVGALFSIAIAIRTRKIRSATILRDNLIDAGLRVLVGSISAVLLVDLVYLNVIQLQVGELIFNDKLDWSHILVIGIFAGFFERFVPDMLERLAESGQGAGEPSAMPGTAAVAGVLRDETSPLTGKAPQTLETIRIGSLDTNGADLEPSPDPDDVDGCCDQAIGAESGDSETDDIELPQAIGGVAEIVGPESEWEDK